MSNRSRGQRLRDAFRRDLWITLLPALALVAGAFALAFHYVRPAPPRKLVVAVPTDEGGGRYFAKRYTEILARSGVTLEVRETDGTEASLKLLADADTEVEAAFVQGGVQVKGSWEVYSLASLAVMPVWVFYRGETALHDPAELRGKRVAVGAPGSGTRALSLSLLEANGVTAPGSELIALDVAEAETRLAAGTIDALITVAPAESPVIRRLVKTPGFRLMSFDRAVGYTRVFQHLRAVELPRGVYDLGKDLPPTDVHLLATTSNLVVAAELHPALAYLLLRAATEVHSPAGLIDRTGEFPQQVEGSYPPTAEAQRYFTTGTPLIQRFLPFWAANLVERLWVMLLPIVAVVLPVVRLFPPIYQWRIRSRIYRWYSLLKRIEIELDTGHDDREALLAKVRQLDELDAAIRAIPTPLPYSENLYAFRGHIDFVRQRIRLRLDAIAAAQQGAVSSLG